MNIDKVQAEINKIVENYRTSDYKGGRNQYPASKKHIARAEELGILEFIPNAPYAQHIGNTEIQLIIAEAEKSDGEVVSGMTEDGEGDSVNVNSSALHTAINEKAETITVDADGETNITVDGVEITIKCTSNGEYAYPVIYAVEGFECDDFDETEAELPYYELNEEEIALYENGDDYTIEISTNAIRKATIEWIAQHDAVYNSDDGEFDYA